MLATFLLAAASLASAQTKMPPAANQKVDFERDVQPILSQKCHSCHGEEVQQSGLRLDKRQNALRGGDYGPVIITGNSAESKLIKRLVKSESCARGSIKARTSGFRFRTRRHRSPSIRSSPRSSPPCATATPKARRRQLPRAPILSTPTIKPALRRCTTRRASGISQP